MFVEYSSNAIRGCTTNMAKHLRQQHGIQIKECTVFDMLRQPPSSSQASSSPASPAQPTASTSSSEPSQSDESSQSSLRPNVTAQANKLVPQCETPVTLAAKGKLLEEKVEECHRKVTANVVKRLHPFSEAEAPTFRDMLSALNPKYIQKMTDNPTVWDRMKERLLAGKLTDTEQLTVHDCGGDGERSQSDKEGVESEEEEHPPPCKTVRMTPLEEFFADEDAVKMTSLQTSTSIQDEVEKELQTYKDMPPIVTSDDPAAWWWNMRTTGVKKAVGEDSDVTDDSFASEFSKNVF
ncbi:hypothetical protein ABVT39_017609 [Epinephelus coioides]